MTIHPTDLARDEDLEGYLLGSSVSDRFLTEWLEERPGVGGRA